MMLIFLIKLLIYLKLINIIFANEYDYVYGVLKDGSVCLRCPLIDNNDENNNNNIVSLWSYKSNNNKDEWLCRNQEKFYQTNSNSIKYSCNQNDLCLNEFKDNYPKNYTCSANGKLENVKVKYLVPLRYMSLNPDADYLNMEGIKVTVKENTQLNITCEISETNPKSKLKLTVGNKDLTIASFKTKNVDDGTVSVYSSIMTVKRELQGQNIICEAKMDGIDDEIATKLDIKTKITKKLVLDVQYIPICGNNNHVYNTGYNQSVLMECKVDSANPSVGSYQLIGPTDSASIEPIEENGRQTGKFLVKPKERKDLGKYECFPRNNAGTAKCVLNLILGGPPNPPHDCTISINRNSNKTNALIHCQLGFNQNGTSSDFVVYERLNDGTIKYAGSINAYDSNMKSADYLTREIDEYDYYEFVVMQTNNFGNSSQIILSIGTKSPERSTFSLSKNTIIAIVGGGIGGLLFICLCCCCATNICSSSTSNDKPNGCLSKYCECCSTNGRDDENISYKKATYPDDMIQSYIEDDSKYISTEKGLIYKPMVNNTIKFINEHDDNNDDNNHSDQTDDNDDTSNRIYKPPLSYQLQQQNNNLINSFRTELNYKLQKQRNDLDSKLTNDSQLSNQTQKPITFSSNNNNTNLILSTNNNNQQNTNIQTSSTYESTSSASSSTSNNDLLNSNNNLINNNTINRKEKPPILKPKPRNLLANYSSQYETPTTILNSTTTTTISTTINNNNNNLSSSSPSTSVTDISTCTPQHYDNNHNNNNDRYPIIPSRTNSLIRPKNRPPIPPSIQPPAITTTFNRYITRQINETTSPNQNNDLIYVNNNNNNNNHKKTLIRNSDC